MNLTRKHVYTALLAIAACSGAQLQAKEAPSCPAVQQYGMSLKFQNRSAEVQALQLQAYNLAEHRLKEILQANPQANNLAIVTDLDETVLDNTDVFVSDLKRCEDYTSWKSWDAWEQSGQPKLIPGSLDFLQFADQQGIKIFYVSDRAEKYRQSAMQMMKRLNLPQVQSRQILLYGTPKEQRRQSISKDYEIVLLLGDTLHDFSGAFSNQQTAAERAAAVAQNREKFGDRFIVLPNVSYGAWSKAE